MNFEHICYGCFQEKPDASSVCPFCGFHAEEEQPFLSLPMGTLLNGRYMTGKVLGVGGFGITYLGFDLTLEIKVAIKEYMPSGLATRYSDKYSVALTGRGQEDYQNGMERFLEEARILAKLQNTPNVVSVQNYFKENNTAYFVMEYIDGMSLKEYLASQGGKIPYDQALTILMPVMQALTQVHAMNLTHRDISPDNISLTSKGESKLLDFGAARFSIEDDKSVSVILKHGYAPEEQYSSKGNQGPWTDVYAMGATLYRCVTGELPPDSITRVHNDTLKKPSELGISLPSNLEQVIMKALSVKAENRYPNMESFIEGINGKTSTSFRSHTVAAPSGQITVDSGEKPMNPAGTRKLPKIPRFVLVAVGILLVVGGVLKIASGIGSSGGGKTEPSSGIPGSISDTSPQDSDDLLTENVALRDYSSSYLNITMGIPEGYEETEDGSKIFASTDGSASVEVRFYEKDFDFPVYTLSDVEKNAENYVQYYAGPEENNLSQPQITNCSYRDIGSANAYQIQFTATDSSGAAKEYLAVFVECQNGFGCYNLVGTYPQGDQKAQAEVVASIESFQSSGPAGTIFKKYSNEEFGFQIFYWEKDGEVKFRVIDDNRVRMNNEAERASVEIMRGTVSSDFNKEIILDNFVEGMAKKDGIELYGRRRDTTLGGIDWSYDVFTLTTNDGTTTYMADYAGEIDGHVFWLLAGGLELKDLNDMMLYDVTTSIRPLE